jgi:hypothetical protein
MLLGVSPDIHRGPGYPLIRLQALATRLVSATIPNAINPYCHCEEVRRSNRKDAM